MAEESKIDKIRKQREEKFKKTLEEEAKRNKESIAEMETPVDTLEIKLPTEEKIDVNINPTNTTNTVNPTLDNIKQRYGISEYNTNKKNYQINVRIPKIMYDRFKEICGEMNASCNDTVNKLIRDFIDQCERNI